MLKDLRKELETVDSLAMWLTGKSGPYPYRCPSQCMISQYFTDMTNGVPHGCCDTHYYEVGRYGEMVLGTCRPLPKHFNRIAAGRERGDIELMRPQWTFEKAAARAQKVLERAA